jgi:hypothetical protein
MRYLPSYFVASDLDTSLFTEKNVIIKDLANYQRFTAKLFTKNLLQVLGGLSRCWHL